MTVKSFQADVWSLSSSSFADEGLTLETPVLKLFTVAKFTLSPQLIILNHPEKKAEVMFLMGMNPLN